MDTVMGMDMGLDMDMDMGMVLIQDIMMNLKKYKIHFSYD